MLTHIMSSELSAEELLRYRRQLGLAGFGPEAQARLRAGQVLVVGAGGLGCPALLYLAAAGVGRITLIDDDIVDLSNLQRQVLFTSADAGRPKAIAAAERLRALNPHVSITPIQVRLGRANARALVAGHDVVVDGSDNFPTRYLVNDACVLEGRPLVYGAVQGFEGQAAVFNWRSGPTYRCLFPEPPPAGTVANCAEAGVLGVLPGLVGLVQATEVLKLLTGIGEPLSGRLWLWDALSMTSSTLRLAPTAAGHAVADLPPEGYGETCTVPVQVAEEISAAELKALLDGPIELRPMLLDVREGWERALGRIEPSLHIPLGQLPADEARRVLAAVPRDMPLVAYCAKGGRSLKALPILRAIHGLREVRSLAGGWESWEKGVRG